MIGDAAMAGGNIVMREAALIYATEMGLNVQKTSGLI